jgi:hypothetical protein
MFFPLNLNLLIAYPFATEKKNTTRTDMTDITTLFIKKIEKLLLDHT